MQAFVGLAQLLERGFEKGLVLDLLSRTESVARRFSPTSMPTAAAFFTNRLALDASIQAALAGENGKAFRAVADDIRRSAEVAKTQTNKIERIVKQLLEDIESVTVSIQDTETEAATGAQLSREAGAAFEAIVSAIEYQSREIEMINQAAQQQLQTSSSVAQVMRGVSSSTLQSSQSIREEAKRMERVAQLAEQLLVSAEVFKLRDDQDIFAQTNHEHVVAQQAFPQRSF